MRREQAYGNSLRKLKEIRDEIEQQQADLDAFSDEIETEHARLAERVEMCHNEELEIERIKKGLNFELARRNRYHPELKACEKLNITSFNNPSPEEALRVRILPPKVDWDEKNDRAYVRLLCSVEGLPKYEVYAMSLGQLDYIDETAQVGIVKEMSERITSELWRIIKKRNKNG